MSFPTLGHDPAPGDPHAVRAVAARLGAAAEDAETITSRLRKIGSGAGDLVWRGPAAESFHTLLAQVGPDVIRLANAHREAQDALVYYAVELDRAQDVARRAESDAARATSDRDQAACRRRQAADEAAVQDRQIWECRRQIATSQATRLVWAADPAYQAQLVQYENRTRTIQHRAETGAAQARGREQAARSAESTAAAHLKAAQLLGGQARDVRDAAARRTVDRLDAAGRPAQANRGLVQRLLTGLDDLGRRVVTSPAFDVFLGYLDVMSTGLTVISLTLLALSPLFPPLALVAGAVGIAATAYGVYHFLGTAAGHRYGTRSTSDLIAAGLGAVPLVGKGAQLAGKLVTRVLPAARPVLARGATALKDSRPVREVVGWADKARQHVRPLANFRLENMYDALHTGTDLLRRSIEPLVRPDPSVPPRVCALPAMSSLGPRPIGAGAR